MIEEATICPINFFTGSIPARSSVSPRNTMITAEAKRRFNPGITFVVVKIAAVIIKAEKIAIPPRLGVL